MHVSKQSILTSSITGNWIALKRAAMFGELNGELLEVHITDAGGSTDKGFALYRGTTTVGNRVMRISLPATEVTYRPRKALSQDSTAGGISVSSTAEGRVPWVFANEKPIVMMSTAKHITVTLYVNGIFNTTGSTG